MKRYSAFLIFLAAILRASDAPFRVALGDNLPSQLIVLLEHSIALLILSPLLWRALKEIPRLEMVEWLAIFFVGVGGSAVALILFTESFSYMNPSVVVLLQKLQPLIAIFLAVQILREPTTQRFWSWGIIALLAAYIISFPDLIPRFYEGENFNPNVIGSALALGAAFLWGASTVLGKYVLSKVSFTTMLYLRFLVATVFLLVLNLSSGTLAVLAGITPREWLYLTIISLASGVLAMYLYYRGLSGARASVATIAELGFPAGAVIINYWFLDAFLTPVQLLAMGLLVFAIWQLNKLQRQ